MRAGEDGDRRVVHVNGLQRLGVLGLERRRQTRHTGANLCVQVSRWRCRGIELPCERGERAIRRTTPAKLIGRRIAQGSIEPWHDAFVGGCQLRVIHDLGKRILQDVLRHLPVADAPFEEAQKRAMVLEERLYHNSIL